MAPNSNAPASGAPVLLNPVKSFVKVELAAKLIAGEPDFNLKSLPAVFSNRGSLVVAPVVKPPPVASTIEFCIVIPPPLELTSLELFPQTIELFIDIFPVCK